MSHELHQAYDAIAVRGGAGGGDHQTDETARTSQTTAEWGNAGGRLSAWPHLREVLAAVPVQLGHHPAPGSVVAVGLTASDQDQPRLVARIDAAVLQGSDGRAVAQSVASHLRSMGCARLLVTVYEDHRAPGGTILGSTPNANGTILLLGEVCCARGIMWAGAWVIDPDEVRGYPDGPRFPRSDLADSVIAVRARTSGHAPVARREDLGHIPAASHTDRRAAAEGRLRWSQRRDSPGPGGFASTWGAWQQQSLLTWQHALDRMCPVSRATLGRIEASLEDPLVVEACALILLGCDTETALGVTDGLVAAGHDGLIASLCAPSLSIPLRPPATAPDQTGLCADVHLRPWLAGLLAPKALCPDLDRVHRADLLLRGVVSHGRRARQSGALTLLGLLAWWRGDGVHSAVLIERALRERTVEPLAAQLDWLLSAGAVTGWARASAVDGSPTGE